MENSNNTVNAEETPLERKYKAWGAKSMKDVPRDTLKLRDELFDKEIFDKNLKVKKIELSELLHVLNGNVKNWMQERYNYFADQIQEYFPYFDYAKYSECDYLQALKDRLDEILKGLCEAKLTDYKEWSPVIEAALKLPRFKLVYFVWSWCYEDEGPTEPGLFYELLNGEMQEVHYNVEESDWCYLMQDIEARIGKIISACKEIADFEKLFPLIHNEWLEIEVKWKKCRAENQSQYHTSGDLEGFARAFTDGLLKMSGVLPNVMEMYERKEKLKEEDKSKSQNIQYAEVEKQLAIYAKVNPSIARFQALCSIIADGVSNACKRGDFEIWKSKWLTAGLQLLSEDPSCGSCNLIDRQNLYNAIIKPIENLVSLNYLYQSRNSDMIYEEMEPFYQAINDVMLRNWGKNQRTGERGFLITPNFITREGVHGGWVFNNVNIIDILTHCTGEDAICHFQKAELLDDGLEVLELLQGSVRNEKCMILAAYYLFTSAVQSAEALLESLMSLDKNEITALLEQRNLISDVIQPFGGTYYDPYTQYKDEETEVGIKEELEHLICRLKEIIEQIFQRLKTVLGNSASIEEAEKGWRKVLALYNLRMKSPIVRLSCADQEGYRDIILQVIDMIASCADSGNEQEKAVKESSGFNDSERIAEELWQKLQANPISVKVDGYTKQGEKQTYGIVTKTKPEKSWFSDKVLSGLFQTHPNTIANWRNGNAQAPEGFAEAFRNKDSQKMNECAAKYVLSRSKADAMNTKGVRREISDEQIYREGGNKCVKPQ